MRKVLSCAMGTFSHVEGGLPTMVDVSSKQITRRVARARCVVRLPREVAELVSDAASGGAEILSKKGPVFSTAVVAGVLAAKRTSELIPFCHPLPLDRCDIDIEVGPALEEPLGYRDVELTCTVAVDAKTGVEMEALTGCSVAALCVYDMCKSVSHGIVIRDTHLVEKTGGKSGGVVPAAEIRRSTE